jgi:hypothetical protein
MTTPDVALADEIVARLGPAIEAAIARALAASPARSRRPTRPAPVPAPPPPPGAAQTPPALPEVATRLTPAERVTEALAAGALTMAGLADATGLAVPELQPVVRGLVDGGKLQKSGVQRGTRYELNAPFA